MSLFPTAPSSSSSSSPLDDDLVVQFCKDVESRSQTGYVDFGRYERFNYFVTGSGQSDFVQGFYSGDLMNCEHSYDKLGGTAQVDIICGRCSTVHCKEYKQNPGGGATRGWATFGVLLSCIFVVASTLFFCGGFIYKIRVEKQHGIDALPGMTILSAFLETVSGAGQGYLRPEDQNSAFASEASWEQPPASSSQAAWRPNERKYGSI